MDVFDLFQRLGLALAIGFLIGVERGWRERGVAEGSRTAGLRTFALSGLLGGIAGLLGEALGELALGLIFIGFTATFAAYKWREARHENDYSVTVVVAGMLVFALGAYAVIGDMRVAAAGGVATAALLASKNVLHAWLERLSWAEIRSAVVLAAMTFVALPILPNRGYGPFGALNPYEIWLMAVLIAAVSFAGYVVIRLVGEQRGVLIAGAAGGLVASTAVTLDLARRSTGDGDRASLLAGGAAVAGSVMFLRILVVATVIDPSLFGHLALPLCAAGLVSGSIGLALASGRFGGERPGEPAEKTAADLGNPFDLLIVLRFAALLGLVMMLASALQAWFGPDSAVWLAAAAGLADVDAITLSMARLAGGSVPVDTVSPTVLVVACANSLSKSVMAAIAGSQAFAARFGATMAVSVAVAVMLWWISTFQPGGGPV